MPLNGPRMPVVFPLLPFKDGKCACGLDKCPVVGKHPATLWKELSYGDPVDRPSPGAGAGLKTGAAPLGSGVFVIDIDSAEALERWAELDQNRSPETYTVATNRGAHLYFEHPGFRVKNSSSRLAPKIDIRGDGGMVVAPGSPHVSGISYEVLLDVPIAKAPEWLLEWLRDEERRTSAEVQPSEDDVDGEEREYRRELYAEYLKTSAPARGQALRGKGDQTLFEIVQRGAYDLALPVEDVLELVREHYDPRCDPPWGSELEERVRHKAKDAKTQSTRPQLSPVPRELAPYVAEPWIGGPKRIESSSREEDTDDDDEVLTIEKDLKVTWGEWDIELPPPRFIVQDLIPEDTVGMIVAKGSSLKTWMALSVGIAVSNGQPWLGKFMVEKCNVLIVDFESGQWQLRDRARILGRHRSPGLGHASFPNARIDDEGFWRKLALLCRTRKIGLVLIDSFAAGATGVDENDANAAKPLHLAARFTEVSKSAVVVIHHAKKGESGDERDLVRGTGAIYAGLDWAVTMIPNDENRTRMTVRNIKPWGPRPDDFRIALLPGAGLVLDVAASKEDLSPQQQAERMQNAIITLLSKDSIATKALIAKALGKRLDDVGAFVDGLVVSRRIVKLPAVGFALDDPEARKKRVMGALRGNVCGTFADIRKLAHVDEDELARMKAEGSIAYSAEERWIACG